jgi:hypothetical protein
MMGKIVIDRSSKIPRTARNDKIKDGSQRSVVELFEFFGVWILAFVIFSCNFAPALRSFSEVGSIRGFKKES